MATVPERLSLLRNVVVGALNPFIRRHLARRLSLLNYVERGRREMRFRERDKPESGQSPQAA